MGRVRVRSSAQRRSLLPAICLAILMGLPAWAQPGSLSENPPPQENALRGRVEGFYKLAEAAQWSQAEAYLDEESRATFRQQEKFPILGFEIDSIKIEPSGREAVVNARIQAVKPPFPGAVVFFQTTRWRQVEKVWYLHISPPDAETLKALVTRPIEKPEGGKPTPPPPEDLKFKGHQYNFGTVYQGQLKMARFPFTNQTDHTVTIKNVIVEGEWLRVKLAKKEYKPGESGEVVAEFDTKDYYGYFMQSFMLKLDPGDQTVHLRVTASVGPPPAGEATSKPQAKP